MKSFLIYQAEGRCCTYGFDKEYTDKEFLFNMKQHKVSSPEDRMIEMLQDRIETDQINLQALLEREKIMNKDELMAKIGELVKEYENDNDTIMGVFLTYICQNDGTTITYEWNGEGFEELDKNIGVVKQYV